jgi:hypothetical protein
MRRFLALLFALGLFVPLAACGGDDDNGDEDASASASGTEDEDDSTTTTEEEDEDDGGGEGADPDSDYCEALRDASEAGEELEDAFDEGDPEAFEAGQQILEELRDEVDDDDIADDYDLLIDAFDVFAQVFAEVGADPDAQAEAFQDPEFTEQFEEFTAAGERIDDFNLDECGITLDGETESSSGGSDGGEDTSLEDFADDVEGCEDGDMAACDTLWNETPSGSEAEAFAETCGGEDPSGGHQADCEASFG